MLQRSKSSINYLTSCARCNSAHQIIMNNKRLCIFKEHFLIQKQQNSIIIIICSFFCFGLATSAWTLWGVNFGPGLKFKLNLKIDMFYRHTLSLLLSPLIAAEAFSHWLLSQRSAQVTPLYCKCNPLVPWQPHTDDRKFLQQAKKFSHFLITLMSPKTWN